MTLIFTVGRLPSEYGKDCRVKPARKSEKPILPTFLFPGRGEVTCL